MLEFSEMGPEFWVLVTAAFTQTERIGRFVYKVWRWVKGLRQFDKDRARRMEEERRLEEQLRLLAPLHPMLELLATQGDELLRLIKRNGGSSVLDRLDKLEERIGPVATVAEKVIKDKDSL